MPAIELRPTIDRAWLDRAAADDPWEHAYALWDLERFPDRVRIVSAVRATETVGYLLIWPGPRGAAIVHWHGTGPGADALASGLPPRPLVAVVPPEAAPWVRRARGAGPEYPELRLTRASTDPGAPDRGPGAAPARPRSTSREVRRLTASDRARLQAFAAAHPDPLTAEYPGLDLADDAVWGGWDADRLVGVARAAVRLRKQWIVGGVYVDPAERGHGWGAAIVGALLDAATTAGAHVGLYVREDRPPALALYRRLGFVPTARRRWIDLGAGLEP